MMVRLEDARGQPAVTASNVDDHRGTREVRSSRDKLANLDCAGDHGFVEAGGKVGIAGKRFPEVFAMSDVVTRLPTAHRIHQVVPRPVTLWQPH